MNANIELVSIAMEMIGSVGFPIFISFYLLHRFEAKLDSVVKAVNDLAQVLSRQNEQRD